MSGPIVPGAPQAPPGSTASALEIIKGAMRLIHVLEPGAEPPGPEANDALVCLNQMIDGWNAEKLMIPATEIQDFQLAGNKQVYTLGTGGDFDTPRPARITGVSIVLITNQNFPLERPIPYYTDDQWQERVPIKAIPSTFPQLVYDDQAFPLRNLSFWPVPIEADLFRMYSDELLTQFPNIGARYGWRPGYMEALKYNLALVLADEWAGELGQTVVAGAQATKARIKTANVTIETLKCDPAVTGGEGGANYRANMFNLPY